VDKVVDAELMRVHVFWFWINGPTIFRRVPLGDGELQFFAGMWFGPCWFKHIDCSANHYYSHFVFTWIL